MPVVDPSQWYLTFVSIVFGVFFAVWIVPISRKYYGSPPSPPITGLRETLSALRSLDTLRGAITFVMLVCLWWWYGTVLARISPAVGFWTFLYDFISLCSFAVAFQMWSHRSLFPMVVFLAAALMLGRFWVAYFSIPSGSPAQMAVLVALWTLGLFIFGAFMAVAGAVFVASKDHHDFHTGLECVWKAVEVGVMVLLVIGIGVTFWAVWTTEGAPFQDPQIPAVWMRVA